MKTLNEAIQKLNTLHKGVYYSIDTTTNHNQFEKSQLEFTIQFFSYSYGTGSKTRNGLYVSSFESTEQFINWIDSIPLTLPENTQETTNIVNGITEMEGAVRKNNMEVK